MAVNNDRWHDNPYRDDYGDRGRDWNRTARERDRGVWERTGDEVRSWFGDDEAERRRRMDEAREPYRSDRFSTNRFWSDRDRFGDDRPRYRAPSESSVFGTTPYYPDRYGRAPDTGRYGEYPTYRYGTPGPFTGRGPRGYHRPDERIREDVCDRLTYAPDVDASDIDVQVANSEVVLKGTVASREEKRRAEDLVEDILGVRDVHNEIRVSPQAGRGMTELNLTDAKTTPTPIGEPSRAKRNR